MRLNSFLLPGLRQTALGLTISLVVAGALAQPLAGSVRTRYPAGSISTVEEADRALADASVERDAAERRYGAEQESCYTKFFATSCMDESRERRRKALAEIRAVEVEANEFKRKERAAERDREVAQRIADSEAKQAEREKELQQQQRQAGDAAKKPEPAAPNPAAQEVSSGMSISERTARHEAKLRRIQAEDAANAAKRAENIAAYERKQREAEEHQKEVENRKAEKERERLQKAISSPASPAPQ